MQNLLSERYELKTCRNTKLHHWALNSEILTAAISMLEGGIQYMTLRNPCRNIPLLATAEQPKICESLLCHGSPTMLHVLEETRTTD